MRLLITAALFLAVTLPAQAAQRQHRNHVHAGYHHTAHRHHHRSAARTGRSKHKHASRRRSNRSAVRGGGGMVTVSSAAGPITVASHLAGKFQALIADFVANGYTPQRVGCLAHGGHVAHSRHYAGAACDFDQRGWGKTADFMYHAHALIAKHGLRDGCSFGDCGHVDDGQFARYAHRGRVASHGG
jgi:hypothetical protein